MKFQAVLCKGLFIIILGIVFATIGYLAFPLIFETVMGSDFVAGQNAEVQDVTRNTVALWFAALGLAVGIGTLLCSVESTKKQVVSYFLVLLLIAIGFCVVWTYFMQSGMAIMVKESAALDLTEFTTFTEIPQFAAVAVLVVALIVYIRKTKDH